MKIICFIVVLIEIMKEVNSLECHDYNDDEDPKTKKCEEGEVCGYDIGGYKKPPDMIFRKCMPKGNTGLVWLVGKCIKKPTLTKTTCACDTDFCNYNCSVGICPTEERRKEKNVVCNGICKDAVTETPTDATTTNETKINSIDDNSRATSEDGPQPTDDSTGTTGEEGPQSTEDGIGATGEYVPQPTEDRSGATAEDAEETQKPTAKASTNSGNLRVVLTVVLGYFY